MFCGFNISQIAITTLLVCGLNTVAFAQHNPWGMRKPEVNKYTALSSKIQIPDLPDYAGPSKFLFGSQITGRGAGVAYMERWLLRDTTTQAHEWYRATMTNFGWKISLNTKSSIYAEKDGSFCSININGTYHNGWGSEVVVNYSPKEH
jgi:hypothetical protein